MSSCQPSSSPQKRHRSEVDPAVDPPEVVRVVELLKAILKGRLPFVPHVDVNKVESRDAAQEAFAAYINEVSGFAKEFADEFVGARLKELEGGWRRVPIACNSGASGSGKTTQLQMLCSIGYESSFSIPVYFSLRDPFAEAKGIHGIDNKIALRYRLVRRILHGLVFDCRYLEGFVQAYEKLSRELRDDSASFDDIIWDNLATIIRCVWDADSSTPILVAADDLREWGIEPVAEKRCATVAGWLATLSSLAEQSVIKHLKSNGKEGLVYIAASALSAYDFGDQPVFYMPLPPLDPAHFDHLVHDCVKDLEPTEGRQVGRLLRTALHTTRQRADLLHWVVERIVVTSFKLSGLAAAQKIFDTCVDDLETTAFRGVWRLSTAGVEAIRQQTLLRTLFHRTPYEVDSLQNFDSEMRSALRCEAAGIAIILRDAKSRTDAVCMFPEAIESVMSNEEFTEPLDAETRQLVCELCKALREAPAPPGGPTCGKAYERLVVSALALRVATMPNKMTLHELITGRPPAYDDTTFFASTIVRPPGKAKTSLPAAFSRGGNSILDGCVLLDVVVDCIAKKLLLAVQVNSSAEALDDAAHSTTIPGLSNIVREESQNTDWEVVTVYVSPNAPNGSQATARTLPADAHGSPIASNQFKHWCRMDHEDIRFWSPSVAYGTRWLQLSNAVNKENAESSVPRSMMLL